jgi:hypothetical protein
VNTLTTADVLRHAADNLDAGREWCHGLQYRDTVVGWSIAYGLHATTPFRDGAQFRLAPKTTTYTVTHPEPLREAPEDGTLVYALGPSGDICNVRWEANEHQLAALERGNLFDAPELTKAADAARLAAYRGAK